MVRFMRNKTMNWCKWLGLGLLLTGLVTVQPAQGQATTTPTVAGSLPSYIATSAPASQPANNEYIDEFGIEKSQPYDKVFLFWRGRYVDTPIVVERRGLSVYINNIKVIGKSSRFPPRDMRVLEDPGEPPKELSPWQANNPDPKIMWYWLKKWLYLCGQMELKDSVQAIAEVFKKSKGVTEVVVNEVEQGQLFKVSVTADGETKTVTYNLEGYLKARSVPDRQAAAQRELEEMQSGYKQWCQELSCGGFWFNFGLADTIVDRRTGVQIIRVLDSDLPWVEKMAQLEQDKVLIRGQVNLINRMKDTYKSTPQLLQRIRDLETQWALPQSPAVTPTMPNLSITRPVPATCTAPWSSTLKVQANEKAPINLATRWWFVGGVGTCFVLCGLYLWLHRLRKNK